MADGQRAELWREFMNSALQGRGMKRASDDLMGYVDCLVEAYLKRFSPKPVPEEQSRPASLEPQRSSVVPPRA